MLSRFQRRIATLFLGMPEASGFALAGGAALIFWRVVDRETIDLDFFTPVGEEITLVAERFKHVLHDEGLVFEMIRSSPAFVRMAVNDLTSNECVLVDVGHDFRLKAAVDTAIGRVVDVEELAADKLLALFGRAEARDFVDLFHLHKQLGIDRILRVAKQKDPGLDRHVLATMIARIGQLPRDEFQVDDDVFAEMKLFFERMQAQLIDACVDDE